MHYIDVLGYKPQLYIKGNERFHSKFGQIMSLLTILACLGLSLSFFVEFFNHSKLSILSEETFTFDKIINVEDFPFLLRITDTYGNSFSSNITYPVVTYWQYNAGASGSPNISTVPLEDCDINKHFTPSQQSLFGDFIGLNSFLCIAGDRSKYSISGIYGDTNGGYSVFITYLAKCVNNSQYNPGVTCASQSAIDVGLSNLSPYLNYAIQDVSVSHKNVSQPLQKTIKTDKLLYAPQVMYRNDINIEKVEYNSDSGYVFEDLLTYQSYGYKLIQSSIYIGSKFRLAEAYGVNILKLYEQQQVYNRSYLKLQVVAANVGGVVKFIFVFSSFIVEFVTGQYHIFNMINILDLAQEPNLQNKDSNVQMIPRNNNLNILKQNEILNVKETVRTRKQILEQRQHENNQPIRSETKNVRSKNFKIVDAFIFGCCIKPNSPKYQVKKYESLFREILSVENFIRCNMAIKNEMFNGNKSQVQEIEEKKSEDFVSDNRINANNNNQRAMEKKVSNVTNFIGIK